MSAYRIWSSCDLGDKVYVQGMYNNKGHICRKSDNSVVGITEPDGATATELLNFHKFVNNVAAVRTASGHFHLNLTTLEPVIYKDPETGKCLSYFSKTKSNRHGTRIYDSRRVYDVDPESGLITRTKFRWFRWFF